MAYSSKHYRVFDHYGICYYCGRDFESLDEREVQIDHAIPQSRGGIDDEGNLVVACRSCNRLKNSKTPWEFKKFLVNFLDRLGFTIEEDFDWPGEKVDNDHDRLWKVERISRRLKHEHC